MGTALLPQVLSNHFEDHIDKAIGIASSGGSLGAFVLPILVDKIIVEYGTSGMFMILSGVILNGVPAALLLRKLDDSVLKCKKNADGILKGSIYGKHEITESIKKDHIHEEKHVTNMELNTETSSHQNKRPSENFKVFEMQNDTISYINVQQENNINESTYHEGSKHPKALNAFINENTLTDVKIVAEDRNINHPAILQNVVCSEPLKESSELTNNSLYSQCSRKGKSSSTPNEEGASSNSFHVFLDVTYILILLTMGFMQIVITTLGTVIVDASTDKGVPESDGVDILICMSFTDMIGRFCLGYITDGGYMTKINFQILCIGGFVIFHILFIFAEGFIMVMISVGFVGFFAAGHIMINIGIINQCIEKEFLTMASASRFFAFAFMSFVQAPMIGFFRENLKSYNGLFILMSGISGICMVLTWLTPIAAKRRDKKKLLR
ncbi:uncharacterized protein TNCT_142201 [Trichonephila clavata]|uniref:Monocarboxylate transporter n=1 Tax=Trichonephila clavata TaxID=2740835 RepID=A0A8X6KGM6_TRICU|nr:uncharacterized protein TNCT_142201 [Trichonephila clavata]